MLAKEERVLELGVWVLPRDHRPAPDEDQILNWVTGPDEWFDRGLNQINGEFELRLLQGASQLIGRYPMERLIALQRASELSDVQRHVVSTTPPS